MLDVPAVTMELPGRLTVQHMTYLGATASGRYALLWLNDELWTVEVHQRRVKRWPGMCSAGVLGVVIASIGDAFACRASHGEWSYLELPSGAPRRARLSLAGLGVWGGRAWAVEDRGTAMRAGPWGSRGASLVDLPERGALRSSPAGVLAEVVSTTTVGSTRLDLDTTRILREAERSFAEWADPLAAGPVYAVQQLRVVLGAVVTGPPSLGRVGCASGRCVGASREGAPIYYREADMKRTTGPNMEATPGVHFFSVGAAVVGVKCLGTPLGDGEIECTAQELPRLVTGSEVRRVRIGKGVFSPIAFAEPEP